MAKRHVGREMEGLINFSLHSKYIEHMKIAKEPGQNGLAMLWEISVVRSSVVGRQAVLSP